MPMNYRGNVTASIQQHIESKQPMGPNYFGELMWPTGATYDALTDLTRVTFTLTPPATEVDE